MVNLLSREGRAQGLPSGDCPPGDAQGLVKLTWDVQGVRRPCFRADESLPSEHSVLPAPGKLREGIWALS